MGNDLASYIERLELMTFFAGYPFIYALVYCIAGYWHKGQGFINKLVKLLPFAYALIGTLLLVLVVRNLYPDFFTKNILVQFQSSFIKIWGLLSILFWVPVFSKKTIFSLLHSLVFFFLLLKDLFMNIISSLDKEMVQNDMKMYTISLLLNIGSLLFIAMIHFTVIIIMKNKSHLFAGSFEGDEKN